jgi:hypothetical protein
MPSSASGVCKKTHRSAFPIPTKPPVKYAGVDGAFGREAGPTLHVVSGGVLPMRRINGRPES